MKLKRITALIALMLALAILSGCALFNINNPKKLFSDAQTVTVDTPEEVEPVQSRPLEQRAAVEVAPEITPEPTADPSLEVEQNADVDFMQNRVNIMLLGLDRSNERSDWGSFRTDTMILVTVNFDSGKVDMISIPRDSYVRINGGDKFGKINSAFSAGGGLNRNGYQYAMNTVSKLMGSIPINYYVGFDMQVVKDVVDAMGGVDYNVDIEVNMNGRKLVPGMQHMNGQAVLDYARQRKGSSDVARVGRQQQILMAVFDQLKSTRQIFNIPRIYMAVKENIDTNLSFAQICSLALQAARTDREQIERHIVEGSFLNMDNLSYWGISQSKLQKLVKDVFGINMPFDEEIDVYSIKDKLAEQAEQLKGLMDEANSYMRKANAVLKSGRLDESQYGRLAGAVNDLDAAMDSQDAEAMQAAIASMAQVYDAIIAETGIKVVPAGSSTADQEASQSGLNDQSVPDESIPDESVPDEAVPDGLIPEE